MVSCDRARRRPNTSRLDPRQLGDRNEFRRILKTYRRKKRANPIWFQLEGDAPSSKEEIYQLEANIDAQLPDEYRQFVTNFGSGYFAFSAVYSPNPDSNFPLEKTNFNNQGTRKNHIIFSENGSGDHYGFQVSEKKCSSGVFFLGPRAGGMAQNRIL